MLALEARNIYKNYINGVLYKLEEEVNACVAAGQITREFETEAVDWMMPFVWERYSKKYYWPEGSLTITLRHSQDVAKPSTIVIGIVPEKIMSMTDYDDKDDDESAESVNDIVIEDETATAQHHHLVYDPPLITTTAPPDTWVEHF